MMMLRIESFKTHLSGQNRSSGQKVRKHTEDTDDIIKGHLMIIYRTLYPNPLSSQMPMEQSLEQLIKYEVKRASINSMR